MEKLINVTGYSYIDEVIEQIKNTLPDKEKKSFDKMCKNIYLAGITEGLNRSKNIEVKRKKD